MARKQAPPIDELDQNIVALVKALNAFRGVTTVGSCGGHPHPEAGQMPAGEWTVTLRLAQNEHGWRALEFLAWFVNNDASRSGRKVRLEPFSSPPYLNTPGECLVFRLLGWEGEDPDEFARALDVIRKQSYVPPKSGRLMGG